MGAIRDTKYLFPFIITDSIHNILLAHGVEEITCNRPVNLQEIYGEYFNALILLSSQYVINERYMRCIELNTTEGGEIFFFFFVHTLILNFIL